MKSQSVWSDTLNIPENGDNCVYDISFSPDGLRLVAAIGFRIIIYDTTNGTTIKVIKEGHKGLIYALSYATEGKIFASGSQDKTVIVWTSDGNGIVKYTHNEAIQCLAFNPNRELLVSCSANDFGLWTQDKKNVNKIKVSAKINVVVWGRDGELMALGLANGIISLRNSNGDEQGKIERNGGSSAAIWGLSFASHREDGEDKEILVVGDWSQVLSFYTLAGKQLIKERPLGFDPIRLIYVNSQRDAKYIVVVGSNRGMAVFTLDGIRVASLAEQSSWIWACAIRPSQSNPTHIAIGTGGGVVALYEVQVLVVHALFKHLYAFRVNMTDVKVQNLDEGVQVVMKCRDLIKKVAISNTALAVQLPEKILIYTREERSNEFKYRLAELVTQRLECNLLVMCTEHLVTCAERKLQCYTLNGQRVREWNLESSIRYIRCFGGPQGNEVLLAGLKDGSVVKIFLNNLFPVNIVRVPQSVRCLDLNHSHTRIGVIDDSVTLYVYQLDPLELLFQEPNALTVFWNSVADDLLSFSSLGNLSIKANGYKTTHQKMNGFVVGFSRTRIFSMNHGSVQSIEISLSIPLRQYVDDTKYGDAFRIACLGVGERDWLYLGNGALKALDFEIAKKAFAKLNKIEIVRLIKENEPKIRRGGLKPGILMGEVLAYQGSYPEAAKLFKENGEEHRAVAMYADLRMFDHAQEFLSSGHTTEKMELMKKKADWAVKINEFRVAAEMYLAAGEKTRAIVLMERNGWTDMLLELGPKLSSSETKELSACAEALVKLGQVSAAAELFRRFGAMDKVLGLYVSSKDWDEVFLMANKYPEYRELAYLPYAQWLAEQDRFTEAQKAYHEAGRPEEAFKVLFTLKENSQTEMRYGDVSYYHWILAEQYLDIAGTFEPMSDELNSAIGEFEMHLRKGMMYFCYHTIYSYIETPFTPYSSESLFNISRFLMLELISDIDIPVPKFHLLYALAKQARRLEAFKLSRYTIERIHGVRVPESLEGNLDALISASKADPIHDNPELLPLCYRCSTTNPLLNPTGNRCLSCSHPFVYAFPTFEVLPLIQFQLEDGISDEEAVSLIGSHLGKISSAAPLHRSGRHSARLGSTQSRRSRTRTIQAGRRHWADKEDHEIDVLQLEDDGSSSGEDEDSNSKLQDPFLPLVTLDPFTLKTSDMLGMGNGGNGDNAGPKIGREILRNLEPREVIICKWRKPLRFKFYKNCLPETPIVPCQSCWMLFHADDFIVQMLSTRSCPFCRVSTKPVNDSGDTHS